MADEHAGQDTQEAQAASGAQGGGEKAGGQVTAPPAGGSLTQADVDRIVQERLSRERASAEKSRAELQAQLEAYQKAEEERKAAEMTEAERLKAEVEKARAEAQQLKADAEREKLRALRADAIAEQAADLPAEFKRLVEGSSPEELTESIGEARKKFEVLQSQIAEATLAAAVSMTDEQLAERYGETGKAFAAARQGRPFSIGGPSNASGQDDDTSNTRNETLTPLQQMLAARNRGN